MDYKGLPTSFKGLSQDLALRPAQDGIKRGRLWRHRLQSGCLQWSSSVVVVLEIKDEACSEERISVL